MLEKFLKHLVNAAAKHFVYIWGAQGEKVKSLTKTQIRNMESSETNYERVLQFIAMLVSFRWLTKRVRAFDCSGLVCFYLVKVGREGKGFDTTADNLAKRYPLSSELKPGMLLHRSGHIAVYMGHSHLIEAKGRDYGVVVSPFIKSEWDSVYADPFANER